MKDTFYFSHDYNTRSDTKIRKLIMRHGMVGYGIFWSVVEELYQNANALPTDYDLIAFDLRTDSETVRSVIEDFELFRFDEANFGSMSIQSRLDDRNEKIEKARQSAFKRWDKANAMRTHSEGNASLENRNAIKERKGKEKKGNESKENETIEKEKKELIWPFENDDFKSLWQQWKEYKAKEHGYKYKSMQSEQAALMKIANLAKSTDQAKAIIMQSMENGWKGFFELKTQNNNTNGKSSNNKQGGTGAGFDLKKAFAYIDEMYERRESRSNGDSDSGEDFFDF